MAHAETKLGWSAIEAPSSKNPVDARTTATKLSERPVYISTPFDER